MNKELIEALTILEKEKDISREVIMEAIENSLLTACKNHFGKADNIHVHMDRETGDYEMYAEKTVVEQVTDPALEISLEDAQKTSARPASAALPRRMPRTSFCRNCEKRKGSRSTTATIPVSTRSLPVSCSAISAKTSTSTWARLTPSCLKMNR